MAPPGRKSNSQTGLANPWGPHHTATHFGSVHALSTSSLGASNTRVSTNSRSSPAMMFPVAMFFPLFLYVSQIVIEPVKAVRPEPPVVRYPIGDVLEWRGGDPAGPPLRLTPARNQAGAFQHLEVPGNGGHAHGKGRSDLRDRGLAGGQAREDGPASRVGERGERGAQVVRRQRHKTLLLNNRPVKYYRNSELSRSSCKALVGKSTTSGNAADWEAIHSNQTERTGSLQRLFDGDRGAFSGSGAGLRRGRGHFVVEADNAEAEEGDGVLGAEHAFVVDVDVEEFVEGLDVTHAAVVRAGANNAVEAGAAPGGAGRIETEGAVGMRDGAEINVCAAVAREGDLDARIGLAGDLHGGVEARVDNVAGRSQAAQPAGVDDAARDGFEELDDFAAHAFGDFQRRNREVELLHAAADEFHQKPKKKAAEEGDLGPDFEVIRGGVFIEMTNGRMNGARVEARAVERVEIGNQAGAGGNPDFKIFVARDALVDSRADAAALAERAAQPSGIGLANALAGNVDPDLDAAFEKEGDQIVEHGAFGRRWLGCRVRSRGGRIRQGRGRVHDSIISLMGAGGSPAGGLFPLK